MSAALATHTYLPADRVSLAEISDALSGDEFALVGPSGRIALPGAVHDVLVQVVESMLAGKAVHVTPSEQLLTTQQAADMLGMSRPTVVAILERGELLHEMVGTHRRIRIGDLLEYRGRRREEQMRVLAEMQADIDDDASGAEIAEQSRAVRKQVAAARRARAAG